MKAEAFRDDLSALGYVDFVPTPRSPFDFRACFKEGIAKAHARAAELALTDRAFAGIQGDSLTFTGVDLGVSHVYVDTDSGFPFRSTAMDRLANPAGSGMVGYIGGGTDREWHFTHTDGTQFSKIDPAPGESYGAWAMKCAEEAERNRVLSFKYDVEVARAEHYAWIESKKSEVAAPEGKTVSSTDGVLPSCATISFGGRRHGKSWFIGDWLAREARQFETMWVDEADEIPLPAWLKLGEGERVKAAEKRAAATNFVRVGDMPGIAAMAAKAVQPAPDPVVSVLGQQVAQSELTEALALIRQKNAPPPEPQAPIGLMFRDESFDHRLGAWRG